MKMFFEEPVVRVEKFTAESVMTGSFTFLSGYLGVADPDNNRTHAIKPY